MTAVIDPIAMDEEAASASSGPDYDSNIHHDDASSSCQSQQTIWSGLETQGMQDAKCSLLLQEEVTHEARIKVLPQQRVLVYQDKGFHAPRDGIEEENFYVDFKGATVLQLEPTISHSEPQKTMPIILTVGGRCVFTPENYQDFRVMMRTKEQSEEMAIAPNGNFDWPDVNSLLLCPCCGRRGPIPRAGDKREHEYWMLFFPLLQITVLKGAQMTLGTRTVCRLTCLECMDDLLEGLSLQVMPGGNKNKGGNGTTTSSASLAFTLPAADVLAEAGSASFLEDGPPRPESHPHVDDILDAWTLYNLWEHSGAWEALQNDYRLTLSRSMHPDGSAVGGNSSNTTTNNSGATDEQTGGGGGTKQQQDNRFGRPCGNPDCSHVHGQIDEHGDICRLCIKCRECHSEFYCCKACREECHETHLPICHERRQEREERREKKAKKVECDTCGRKFPYTKMKKCSSCRNATYCSVDCQRVDWQSHKYSCKRK